jgi:hypothetical protein
MDSPSDENLLESCHIRLQQWGSCLLADDRISLDIVLEREIDNQQLRDIIIRGLVYIAVMEGTSLIPPLLNHC